MDTFAQRLTFALQKKNLSQTEAARICGIAQQSLNYIISNNLKSSKLGTKISTALNINPEWLVLGQGKFDEIKYFEIPILQSANMVTDFLAGKLNAELLSYTIIDYLIEELSFAFLLENNVMVICSNDLRICSTEYLSFINKKPFLIKEKKENSFPILEWRKKCVI